MTSQHSPRHQKIQQEIPGKLLAITNVNFTGDEKGNHVATIEAWIKLHAEYDQLNREVINDIIVTTTDKLKNQLNEYQEILSGKLDWIGPLGIVISLVAALVASDFKDSLYIKADAWQGIFIVAIILSTIWLAFVFYKIFKHRNKRNINYIVQKIKKREDL
jgi:hypothetical protein